jgi:cytosine/adenosine deaminase-related metal-dependent hydrolase
MPTLLIRNAQTISTQDDSQTELHNTSVFVRDQWIEAIGPAETLPDTADTVIDARHHVVIPGLINTHHHM